MLKTKAVFSDNENKRELENRDVAYRAALEGIVLLENDGTLPFAPGKIALYGAGARKTIKGGTGSGEVNERFSVSIEEGLEQQGFSITTSAWLDDYDKEYEDGLNYNHRKIRKKLFSLDIEALINIMSDPYQYPFGRIITEEDIRNSETDTCIYVVARQAGEGSDRRFEKYDISLSPQERENLRICGESYKKVIVAINAGSAFDVSFMEEIPGINALIYMGQLGCMGGVAMGEIISGKISPSGKLSDTWARGYDDIPFAREFSYLNGNLEEEDYREGIYVGYRYFDSFQVEPRYPFGFGLSYTDFSISAGSMCLDKTILSITVRVRNEGRRYSGKEVVQLYISCPQEDFPKEYQRLAAFAKTGELAPGDSEELLLRIDISDLASYSESRAVFSLSAGNYLLRLGNSSRHNFVCGVVELDQETVISRHEHICPLQKSFDEIEPPHIEYTDDLSGLPRLSLKASNFIPIQHDYSLPELKVDSDVRKLAGSLSVREQIDTVAGTGMVQVFLGGSYFTCPGAVGNTTSALISRGYPNVTFADGPAGLRLLRRSALKKSGRSKMIDSQIDALNYLPGFLKRFLFGNPRKDRILYQYATAFPVEISMAQTWNTELLEEMGRAISREMSEYGVTFWLGPGLNIHRNPLCGRNYEYYSEDPLLSGRLAGAVVRGCESIKGNYASLKHFVANNQEDNRNHVSSNLGERALREIYLRGFGIALKEGGASAVMTSYNRLNGVYTPNSYDLCTRVLRNEWGFSGLVMTDWVSTGKGRADEGLCIKAGNDLIMPGDFVRGPLKKAFRKNIFSKEELFRCSANVLQAVKNSALRKELLETYL